MPVCDICDATLTDAECCLLTTRQVVGNPAYWQFALAHQWPFAQGPHADTIQSALVARQAGQSSPWLTCLTCATILGVDLEMAKAHARQRIETAGEWLPPDCGPVPLGEVRMAPAPAFVPGSELPRPSRVYVYGQDCLPSDTHVLNAIERLASRYSRLLMRAHFEGIVIHRGQESASDGNGFYGILARLSRQYPWAHLVELMMPDEQGVPPMLILVVWDGALAATARELFMKQHALPPPPPSAGSSR